MKILNFKKKEENQLKINLKIANVSKYKCFECGKDFEGEEGVHIPCPSCGSNKPGEIIGNLIYFRKLEVE